MSKNPNDSYKNPYGDINDSMNQNIEKNRQYPQRNQENGCNDSQETLYNKSKENAEAKKEKGDVEEPIRCEIIFHMKDGLIHSNFITTTTTNLSVIRENILKALESKPENGLLIMTGTNENPNDFCILPQRNIRFINLQVLKPNMEQCDNNYQSLFSRLKKILCKKKTNCSKN